MPVSAQLVGGDRPAFEGAADVIACFADKVAPLLQESARPPSPLARPPLPPWCVSPQVTHLGPAGSGHLVKSINNALLAANLLSASEGVAAIARYGIDVPSALQAIDRLLDLAASN